MNLPAYDSKDHDVLDYILPNGSRVDIHQDNASADSTGRTIWLGAQVLAVYLWDLFGANSALASSSGAGVRRQSIVDVGAGTGLTSLSLASIGYEVLATDLDLIVNGILDQNIKANQERLRINGSNQPRLATKVLDWFTSPNEWEWTPSTFEPPFNLIVTADTVYDPELSQPLLRTLHGLASSPHPPRSSASPSSSAPLVYVALEARDPTLVTEFLESAERDWNFKCSRVDHSKLKKLVEAKANGLGWEEESTWEGVEIWKLKLRKVIEKKRRTER